jgi:hypothetical protein
MANELWTGEQNSNASGTRRRNLGEIEGQGIPDKGSTLAARGREKNPILEMRI